MLIPLPGGHFADPATIDGVTCQRAVNGIRVFLVHKTGALIPAGIVRADNDGPFDLQAACDMAKGYVAQIAAVVNAALAPKGVEEVAAPRYRDSDVKTIRKALKRVASFSHISGGQQWMETMDDIQKAITLLESTPPKPSPRRPLPVPSR